ncbi:MAG: hypothetical protein Tsb0021_14510 [Chlamydiales bacterium]
MKRKIAKKIFCIGSGKGGVGKSTVAVNLAVALGLLDCKVGLLDADIYGPSIPIMTGLRQMSPRTTVDHEGHEIIIPFTKFGIHILSIGFFIEEARSILWRGPMLHGILEKMVMGTNWGELDVLLIDLPPGTGDVPLSLSRILEIDGAYVVSTPQEVAMLDAIKSINCFHQLHIPTQGIIENMAGFTDPKSGENHALFGRGKAQELANKFNIPLIGSIPLFPAICQGGDAGYPAAYHSGDEQVGYYFREIGLTIYGESINAFATRPSFA